jgi:DNA polymerase-3 subunit delta
MNVEDVIREARAGRFRPVHVLTGTERFLLERAVKLLHRAVTGDGPPGFNHDVFHGKGLDAKQVVRAANTVPMLATARFVLVRDLDEMDAEQLDVLAAYIERPSPTTCLVLLADKLDGRTRLAKAARKHGVLTEANELRGTAVRDFAIREARERGHSLAPEAADALVDAIGSDLAVLDDALERLSLYVGAAQPITLGAVEACVTRVRVDTIWSLVDAVTARDARTALRSARSMLEDRESPVRILNMVSRQLRIVARMREALARGLRGPDAAKAAGAPPFKARDLEQNARRFDDAALAAAFRILADADLALKGSRVPPEISVEHAVGALCSVTTTSHRR